MLVELKNGETLNGHLVNCDTYMNLTLKEVVQTSPDGDKFFRLPECYVRGNNVSAVPWTRAIEAVNTDPTWFVRSNTSGFQMRLST